MATPIANVKPTASLKQSQRINVAPSRYSSAIKPVVMKMSKNDDFVPQQDGTKFTQQFRIENPKKVFRSNSQDSLQANTAFQSTRIQDMANMDASLHQNMSIK